MIINLKSLCLSHKLKIEKRTLIYHILKHTKHIREFIKNLKNINFSHLIIWLNNE